MKPVIPIVGILLFGILTAEAAIPDKIEPDIGVDVSDYTFELLDNGTYIDFGSNFYATEFEVYDDHARFIITALEGEGYPTKTFGLGTTDGNATITTVEAATVTVELSCTVGLRCDAFYYYDAPMQSISIGETRILPSAFYTNFTAFEAADSPAVYINSGQEWTQTKVIYEDPTVITFETGVFIYGDMGSAVPIYGVEFYKPSASTIPRNINIYTSNDPLVWPAPVISNYTLTQGVGYETVSLSVENARYVKVEMNTFGEADSVRVASYKIETDVYSDTGRLDNSEARNAVDQLNSNIYLILTISALGFVLVAVGGITKGIHAVVSLVLGIIVGGGILLVGTYVYAEVSSDLFGGLVEGFIHPDELTASDSEGGHPASAANNGIGSYWEAEQD